MKQLKYCWRCGTRLEKREKEGRQRYFCTSCDSFVYRNSVPVAGVFVVKDDEVLLIKRGGSPHRDKWSYPAGYLEYDEKPETGAIRELEEETGLKAEENDLKLVSTIHLEHPDNYVVGNAYAVEYSKTEGEITPGSDAQDARLWGLEDMEKDEEDIESTKIIDAAEKAVRIVRKHMN